MTTGALTCYRICKNSSGDEIRTDLVSMVPKASLLAHDKDNLTWQRRVQTTMQRPASPGASPGNANITISEIEVIGNFDSADTSVDGGGNYKYNWVSWDSPAVRMNLSDLPQLGDTI